MAVCKMEMLGVGINNVGVEGLCGRQEARASRPQRVMVRGAKRWPPSVLLTVQPSRATLRLQSCRAASDNADPPHKNYDVNEVVEKVVHDEENQLPAEDKEATPETLPEGEPSPFSPAEENTDDPQAENEGEEATGIYKESLIMPSKAAAASSSIAGDTSLGVSEQSSLAADSQGSGKRDWRVHAASSDEDALIEIFEQGEGGNSADDYKLRAHIFSESAAFFSARKHREQSSSVV